MFFFEKMESTKYIFFDFWKYKYLGSLKSLLIQIKEMKKTRDKRGQAFWAFMRISFKS